MPFVVHTSSTIIQDMIDCGDACAAVRITKVQHYQREVAPLHEFIIVWYHVVNKPEVANYLVIERWGSDVQPPNPTKEKVDKLDIDTGDPAPGYVGEFIGFYIFQRTKSTQIRSNAGPRYRYDGEFYE